MKRNYCYWLICLCLLYSSCSVRKSAQYGLSPKSAVNTLAGGSYAQGQLSLTKASYQQQELDNDNMPAERKVIKNASITISSKQTEKTIQLVEEKAQSRGANVVLKSNDELVVEVLPNELIALVEELKEEFKVTHSSIRVEDVTDAYQDYQIRLESKVATRDRYLGLLDKAVNVAEILEIERELERINTDIEVLKGIIQRLDQNVAYSTLRIRVVKQTKPGVLGYVFVGLYKGIKWLFVRE